MIAHGRDGHLTGIVERPEGNLVTCLIDDLAKVSGVVKQPHANYRHSEIACGFQLISGYVAEAPGVDGQGFIQHEFETEVRDGRESGIRPLALEPWNAGEGLHALLLHAFEDVAEGGVGEGAVELFA